MRKYVSILMCAMLLIGPIFIMTNQVEGRVNTGVSPKTPHAPIRIDSDADFPGIATGGDGSAATPWEIENYEIDGTGAGYCIYIGNTTEHFVVRNCTLSNASGIASAPYYDDTGLILYNIGNGTIENNTINSNNYFGIYLYKSTNNILRNKTLVENGIHIYGVQLSHWNSHIINISNTVNGKQVHYWKNQTGGTVPVGAGQVILANCTNVEVENQNVYNGSMGIELGFSDNNNIANNTASSNNYFGIYLKFSNNNTIINNTANSSNRDGIYLSSSNSNSIANNTVSSNIYKGIVLSSSSNNTIVNNTVHSNSDEGICLSFSSNDNNVYHNNFIDNTNQAFDNGTNFWNHTTLGGNHWSDHVGPDTDMNGIVDNPYAIPGGANQDFRPFTKMNGWLNENCTANNDTYITDEDTILNVPAPGVLANDTDPDPPDVLTVVEINGLPGIGIPTVIPSGAQVTQEANGSFVYDPNGVFEYLGVGDYYGDSYTYMISDGNGSFDNATVFVNVTGVNDFPTGNDDFYNTDEDTALNVAAPQGVLANDTDPDQSDVLQVFSYQSPSLYGIGINLNLGTGGFAYNPSGSVTFQALDDTEYLVDRFNYTNFDSNGGSDNATAYINVSGLNDPPVANPDTYWMDEDGTLNVPAPGVLGNDTDVDIEALTAVLDGSVGAGSLFLYANGSFDYTPDANFTGADTFTYHANDGDADSNIVVVTINVNNTNDPPTATNDSGAGYITDEDNAFDTANVTVNDNDIDGDTLTVFNLDTTSTIGQVVNNTNETFGYDPNGQFEYLAQGEVAYDFFNYTITDGNGGFASAMVNITVNGVNDDPTAVDDGGPGFVTNEAAAFTTASVLTNDTDPDTSDILSVSNLDITSTTGLVVDNTDGTFNYDPNGQFDYLAVGEQALDFFNYTVFDGIATDIGMVTIIITGGNGVPTANDDGGAGYITDEDTAFDTADVTINDTDPDTSDVLAISNLNTTGTIGLVIDNGNNTFNYDPNGQFDYLAIGEVAYDFFNYTVTDGNGGFDTAMVNITINGMNDAPIAVDDGGPGFITDEDTPFTTANVTLNDTDIDTNDVLTVDSLNNTDTIGVVTDNGDGTFNYDPNGQFEYLAAGEQALDFFNYTIDDGNGANDTAMVTIIINGVNDAPTADAGSPYVINEGQQLILDGSGSTDPDGDPLAYAWDLDNDGFYDDASGVNPTVPWATLLGLGLASDGTPLTIGLQVTDIGPATDTDASTLTISNLAPTANAGGPYVINEGQNLDLDGTGSTDPGDLLTFAWDLDNDGFYDDATGVNPTIGWAALVALGLPTNGSVLTIAIQVDDGEGGISMITSTLTINNVAPGANNDAATIDEDSTAVTVDVLANDNDVDALTIIEVTQGAHGTVTITNSGADLTYEPTDPDYFGTDTFTYIISDGEFNDTATVTVTITNVNDDPTANDDAVAMDEDGGARYFDVLANDDFAPDPTETLSITSVTQGLHGTVVIIGGGLTYEPDANYNGVDTFTYTIGDGNGGTDIGTVTITVNNVNDLPVMTGTDQTSAEEGDTYSVEYTATDIDLLDTLTFTLSTDATWLSLDATRGTATGTLSGIAEPGRFSIRISVSDGNGGVVHHDLILDVSRLDTDDDGVPDVNDALPTDANETVDTDGDGIGNNADLDKDGDGVPDIEDPSPLDNTITGNEPSTGWPYWWVLLLMGIIVLIGFCSLLVIWMYVRKFR